MIKKFQITIGLFLVFSFAGYPQNIIEEIRTAYEKLDTLEYDKTIYKAVIESSCIVDSTLANYCNESVGTIVGLNYKEYSKAEKSFDNKIYVLRVDVDMNNYINNGKVSFKVNASRFPFNVFYLKENKVRFYLYTNDEGIEVISPIVMKWVIPYYPDSGRGSFTEKDRIAISHILSLTPEFLLYSPYIWDSYLYVKNNLFYVFNVKLFKSVTIEDYLSNCYIKYGFFMYNY